MTKTMANTSAAERPAPLNPHQQRILAEVIAAAQRKPCGHCAIDRFRTSYLARRQKGITHWSVSDVFKHVLAKGVQP